MFRSLTTAAFAAAITISAVLAAPTAPHHLKLRQIEGRAVEGSYIVKLKNNASRESHVSAMPFGLFSTADSVSPVTHTFSETFFNAYAGKFTEAELDAIMASPDVEYVEPNAIMTAFTTQVNAPWGLQSISSKTAVGGSDTSSLKYTYTFDEPAGAGVDVYIVDTGINTSHDEFEGRATFGWAAPTYQKVDGNGHGTHCAGTAVGKTYGLAKAANVIAVKVLSDEGSGEVADIVSGLQFVVDNAKATGKSSVGSMSLGGSASTALDDAVAAAITAGVPFIIAAGNSNVDAAQTSPARVAAAITVGASTITNTKASFSNFGAIVDVWAPGQNIISAWIGSNTATNNISGTSMATPHVAGLSAYLLGKEKLSPADLAAKIKSLGTSGILTGVPSGTVNLLAFNGAGTASPEPTTTGSSSTAAPTSTSTTISSTSTTRTSTSTTSTDTGNCPWWWPDCPWKNWK